MERYKYDVYICYSQKDWKDIIYKREISRIIMSLDSAGLSYCFNKEKTELWEDRTEIIEQNIKASKVFLYLSTRNTRDDSSCNKEMRLACELNKYIIAVCLDSSSYTDMINNTYYCTSYIYEYAANPELGLKHIINTIRIQLENLKARESEEQLSIAISRTIALQREEDRIKEEIEIREKNISEKKHSLKKLQEIEANLEWEEMRTEEEIQRKKEEIRDVSHSYLELSTQRAKHGDISFTGRSNTDSHSESTVIENSHITYNPNYKLDITPRSSKISIFGRLFQLKKKKQLVLSSVFAPAEVRRATHMLVQVYLHLLEETGKVQTLAQEADKDAKRRDYIPLQCKLKKGDKVDVLMNIYGETLLMSDKKSVVWQGSFTKCSFDYLVPKDLDIEGLSCMAMLSVNGIPAGEIRFITKVVEKPRQLNPEILSHKYNKVFISYSHLDESKVRFLHEGLELGAVPHFFDRKYLKAGDVFPQVIKDYINSADLFILCWSENASKSEYVKKERLQAMKRAFPQIQPESAAKLRIYPMSIEPRVELPKDMKDNYHFTEL